MPGRVDQRADPEWYSPSLEPEHPDDFEAQNEWILTGDLLDSYVRQSWLEDGDGLPNGYLERCAACGEFMDQICQVENSKRRRGGSTSTPRIEQYAEVLPYFSGSITCCR